MQVHRGCADHEHSHTSSLHPSRICKADPHKRKTLTLLRPKRNRAGACRARFSFQLCFSRCFSRVHDDADPTTGIAIRKSSIGIQEFPPRIKRPQRWSRTVGGVDFRGFKCCFVVAPNPTRLRSEQQRHSSHSSSRPRDRNQPRRKREPGCNVFSPHAS